MTKLLTPYSADELLMLEAAESDGAHMSLFDRDPGKRALLKRLVGQDLMVYRAPPGVYVLTPRGLTVLEGIRRQALVAGRGAA